MATNKPTGDNDRKGAVRKRSQPYNPVTEQYVKRDTDTGRFLDVKEDGKPFKGVCKEKKSGRYKQTDQNEQRPLCEQPLLPSGCGPEKCAGREGG